MSSSAISSLINLLDRAVIKSIASRIGENEMSVSRGIRPVMAAFLGVLAEKTNDPDAMGSVFAMIDGVPLEAVGTEQIIKLALSGAAGSPLFDVGRRLTPMLLSGKQDAIAAAIQEQSGLGSAGTARLIAAVAPVVLGFLAKRVRAEGMGPREFSDLLRSEFSEVRGYIPLGIIGVPATTEGMRATPAAALGGPDSTSKRWLFPVLAGIATLASVLWFVQRGVSVHSEANRLRSTDGLTHARTPAPGLGEFVDRKLPDGIVLNIPENGMESRLLSLIQDSTPEGNSDWLNFDRITFGPLSALLGPESEEQLLNVAAILKTYPEVRLKIGGYTDNSGTAKANSSLSDNRANAVARELTSMGIAAERLETEAYGGQHPVADNSTEEGRAMNRRIAIRILSK